MRVSETVEAGYPKLPADLRAVLEAYADGVNYYAAQHEAKVAPGLLPLNRRGRRRRLRLQDAVLLRPRRYPEEAQTAPTDGRAMGPIGSNGVAVAPSRSADGATRLLVNSHQPYTGPVAWYEEVLESGEGWHVAGGFFPGTPFMLHGHNAHLGWASTVNDPDLVDIYD